MRSIIKKRYFYAILCVCILLCALCFSGCGIISNSQSESRNYGTEKKTNDVGLAYDWVENRVVWEHDGSAGRYSVYIEDSQGELYVLASKLTEDHFVNDEGKLWVRTKDTLSQSGDKMSKNVNLLLIAYGDSYENPLWHLRVPYEVYDSPQLYLSQETGAVHWNAIDGAKYYLVYANHEEYTVTEPTFNVLPVIEAGTALKVTVRAMGEENGAWMSTASQEIAVNIAHSPSVWHTTKYIRWSGAFAKNPEGKNLDSLDYSYKLEIYDGEEYICEDNLVYDVVHSLGFAYPYRAKTDNFRVVVTATLRKGRGCDDFLPSVPTVCEPEYKGRVEEVTYNAKTSSLEWEDCASAYYLTVNGEEIYCKEASYSLEKYLTNPDMVYEGELTFNVIPETEIEGYYTDKIHTVIFPTDLDIEVTEVAAYERIRVDVTGFDQWATGCILEKRKSISFEESKELSVQEGKASQDFAITATERGVDYSLYATAVYPEHLIVIPRKSSHTVRVRSTPVVLELMQVNNSYVRTPRIKFQDEAGDFEVEFNGEITTVDDVYFLPAEIYESTEEKEFTIRVRELGSATLYNTNLTSLWKEYTIRTLGLTENLYVENSTLYWDYAGVEAIQSYAISTGYTVLEEEWEIKIYNAGEDDFAVCALADNTQAKDTGIWYVNGLYSERITVEKLEKVENLTHDDYGVAWDAVEEGEEYQLQLVGDGISEVIYTGDTEFVASEYLKEYEKFRVDVKVKGNGVTTINSEGVSFYVTRNPQLTYTMENTTGYYSQIFWETPISGARFDYQLIAPSGKVLDSAKGTASGQTYPIHTATDHNTEGFLEKGEHTLRIVLPAGKLNENTYYLKTGDEVLDRHDKSIYKMWVDISIQDGAITVETFPKLTDRQYHMEYYKMSTYSSTGIFTFAREEVNAMFAELEYKTYNMGVDLSARSEELAKFFAFDNRTYLQWVSYEVKEAPTAVPTYTEYTPGSVYYDLSQTENSFNAKLDLEKTAFSTVKVDAGVDIIDGMNYVFTSYLRDGTVWKTIKTTDRTCVVDLPEFGWVNVFVEADILLANGEYYHSSEAVELEVNCCCIGVGAFFIEDGTVVSFGAMEAALLELWVNGEYVAKLSYQTGQTYAYTYTLEQPLQSGDVIELRGWWRGFGDERSADYYFYKPIA